MRFVSLSRSSVARALGLLALGVLLFAAAAYAQSEADRGSPAPGDKPPAARETPDDGAQMARAVRVQELAAEARDERRQSPAGREARRRSRRAHKGLTDRDARVLAREEFGSELSAGVPDGASLVGGDRVAEVLSDYVVRVEGTDGRPDRLIDSQVPLVRENGGRERLIDLDLVATAEGFEARNPSVDVEISSALAGGIGFGPLTVVPAGEANAERLDEDTVVYPNADVDTDVAVNVTPTGFETFHVLRSEDSPEVQRLSLELPDGASLEPGEGGSVRIVAGGEDKVLIRPPVAFDAEGYDIPVSYEIEGDDVLVVARHRERDFAYPLLIDPDVQVKEDWACGWGSPNCTATWFHGHGFVLDGLRHWNFVSNYHTGFASRKTCYADSLMNDCYRAAFGGPTPQYQDQLDGLHVLARPNMSYPNGTWGEWRYHPPGESTRVARADFGAKFLRNGRTGNTSPFMVHGIRSLRTGQWVQNEAHHGDGYGNLSHHWSMDFAGHEPGRHEVVFGITTFGAGSLGNYWRTAYMGAAIIQLTDPEPPSIGRADPTLREGGATVSAEKWTKDGVYTFDPTAHDPGLGVRHLRVDVQKAAGGVATHRRGVFCDGTKGLPCLRDYPDPNRGSNPDQAPVTFSANDADGNSANGNQPLPEGQNIVTIRAADAIGDPDDGSQGPQESAVTKTVKVDRSTPSIPVVGGSLAPTSQQGAATRQSQHTLSVSSIDQLSGVNSVRYQVRAGTENKSPIVRSDSRTNPQCDPNTGCSQNWGNSDSPFQVDLAGLQDGIYRVEAFARDLVGYERKRDYLVALDRTPPEATSFSTDPGGGWLKDGQVLQSSAAARDALTGVGTFEFDFPAGPPTVTTVGCASVCPGTRSAQTRDEIAPARFPAEGVTKIGLRVRDLAGNESSRSTNDVRVDRSPPGLELGGTLALSRESLLVLPSYDLTYEARDGSAASPEQERSGARQVRVLVRKDAEGEQFLEKHSSPVQDCAAGSCSLSGSWTFNKADYENNTRYVVRVVATDQLGHETVEEFSVYVAGLDVGELPVIEDRTGLEDWWHYESVETGAGSRAHVNFATGNLVWHATPIVNPGRGLQTFANLTYNSQESQEDALRPETAAGDLVGQYNEVGRGFSLGISGVTRLNEPLDLSRLAVGEVTLTDADGTPHVFEAEGEPTDPGYGEVFDSPAGVQLHLWRFQESEPLGGENRRAWAMTRPDGVTYFFDELGYQRSIRDRNGNELRFEYEYRSPTRAICESADQMLVPPDKVCVRKVVRVLDGAEEREDLSRTFTVEYEARTIDDSLQGLRPPGAPSGPLVENANPGSGPVTASGPVSKIVDRAGRAYTFGYDDAGYLKTLTEAAARPDSRSWTFDYEDGDALKRRAMASVTDPRAAKTTFVHATDSELGEQPLGDGLVSRRRVASITDRGEHASAGAGQPGASRTFVYEPDDVGEIADRAAVTDARGHGWDHEMDTIGRPTGMVDPLDTRTTIEWDGEGSPPDNNATMVVEAAGSEDEATTEMVHNDLGQLLQSADPEGRTTTFGYHASGGADVNQAPSDFGGGFVSDVTSITRPRGNATTFVYEGDTGNVRETRVGSNPAAVTEYDAFGQVESETDEVGNVTRFEGYDLNGMPRRMVDPRTKVWTYAYDAVGNLTRAADPRASGGCGGDAFTTRLTYDSFDRVVREVSPKDSGACVFVTRTSGYDANGNLDREVDGNGKVWERSYTAMDELEEERSPLTDHAEGGTAREVSTSEYDPEGSLVYRVSPKGTASADGGFATRFRVDEIGRTVAEIRQSRGAAVEDLIRSMAYDRRDNLVGVVDPERNAQGGDPVANALLESKRRFTYRYDDADNRVEVIEDPGGRAYRTVTRFDANDNVGQVTDPRGTATPEDGDFTETRTYDDRDLLVESADAAGRTTTYERRPDGRPIVITRPRGMASDTQGDHQIEIDYWPTGEVKRQSLPFAADQYGSHDLAVSYALNDVGDPITVTDPRGKTITNTFLDSGELASTTRPSWWRVSGGQLTERPVGQAPPSGGDQRPQTEGQGDFGGVKRADAPGLLPHAGRTEFRYDDELRLTRVTDVVDKSVSLNRDPVGRVIETRRPFDATREIVERMGYDFNGNRVRDTDPLGEVTTRVFDQFDRLISETRPGSNTGAETTRTFYDPNGTVRRVETPRGTGYAYTQVYDALDRPVRLEDPNGLVTTRDYDPVGNLILERSPRGNREPFPSSEQREWFDTTREYNAVNELTVIRNGFGHEWRFAYDEHGNQIRESDPEAARAPDADPVRQVTERSYDGLDRLWTEQTGSAANGEDRRRTRAFEYDPNGLLRRTVNPAGVDEDTGLPRFEYTGDGQVSDSPEAAKNATVHEYNDPADPTLMSAKRLPWGDRDAADSTRYRQTFAYDARGRLGRIDPPHMGSAVDAAKTTYTHFETGWIRSATDNNKTIDYDYDVRGDQLLWKSGQGREMRRSYWPSGQLRTRSGVKPSAGPDEIYRYSYEYNRNRSLTRMTDSRKNRETTYSYDRGERQTQVNESPFEVDDQMRRGKDTHVRYDQNSNVVDRRTDGRFTDGAYVGGKRAAFAFDRLDREISMSVTAAGEPNRKTQTSWWPSNERQERMTDRPASGTDTVERRFHFSDGRLSRIDRRRTGAAAGSFAKNRSYAYDVNGNRTSDERGTHAYNSRDQLVASDETDGPRTTYVLNGSGSITSQTENGQTTTFNYAPDGERLLSASAGGATTTYRYDEGGLGEIVGYSVTGGSPGTTFGYDEFGRQNFTGDGQGSNAGYSFDGLDRRDTKEESGKTLDLSYVGSSESLSQEQQFGGDETRSYDYDAYMDRLGMARRGVGQSTSRYRNYSKDANGSVEGLENDQGEVPDQDRYAYDPYGRSAHTDPTAGDDDPVEEPAGEDAKANPFRFEGHYYDPNVATYDMKARPYLPETGRFMTEDRYESAAGDLSLETDTLTQDRYAFAGGNPVNNIEYDGHEPAHGSYKNNPDRDNPYGGGSNKNVNRDYNFAETDDGHWQINEDPGSGQNTTRTEPIPKAPAPSPTPVPAATPLPTTPAIPGKSYGLAGRPPSGAQGLNGSQAAHTLLAGAGAVPVLGGFADAADGGLYALEGDREGAALAFGGLALSVVPGADQASSAARIARTTNKARDGPKAPSPSRAPTSAASESPRTSFIAPSEGPAIVVPRGATGPTAPRSGTGMLFSGGRGGHGLDPRVTSARIMDAGPNQGRRMSYENARGQKVDPYSGRTISNTHPWAHMPW